MRASASADVLFVAPCLLEPMTVLTNITWNSPSRGIGARETFKAFRKKTSFSIVRRNVLHHVDKKALCSMSVLKCG